MTPERLQEIREPDEVQKARDRALLISEQDKDAPRLTDRLDAQALGVLVAAYDALTADSASLAADYAAAVRALDGAGWALYFAHAHAPVGSNERDSIGELTRIRLSVLSSTRAQSVLAGAVQVLKEVE